MRRKIYFIGDSYRGGQAANIRSLFEALAPAITALGVECSPIYSPINRSTDYEEWSKPWISSLKGECDSALKELDLTSSSVIGFEIAAIDRQYLNAAQVPWISLEIHPLRFLEDLYFDAEASFSIDYSLLAEPEDYIWLRARCLRKKYKIDHPQTGNRLLIVGQAPTDKTVYFDNTFRNLTHYFQQLDEIAARFDSTDYRPHPYLTDLEADTAVISRYSAGACYENNLYKILASGRYRAVAGISSSVLREAPYFELQSYLLEPRARQFGGPISYRKLVQSREVWLSGLLETELPRRPIDLAPTIPENHLRRVFGSWSYVSDQDEVHQALVSLDGRIQHHETSLQVIAESARASAEQQTSAQSALMSMHGELGNLRDRLEREEQQAAVREQQLRASIEHALEAGTQQMQLHAERQASLHQQLDTTRTELARVEQKTEQLHAALSQQLNWARDTLQAQTRANAEAQALAQRLVETHHAQLAEQMQMHAQREREMAQRLDAQLDELRTRLKVQADQAQAELVAAKAQAKAELQSTEQAHSVAQQTLHSDIARLQAQADGAEQLVQQLQAQLEALRLDAQARQQDAQAAEAALRAEVAAQQAHLQTLQSALAGLSAERSLLEASVLGRLSLRQVRRKRAAQGHGDPLPVAPASTSTGGSAAPTSASLAPSPDMSSTPPSLDPDQARLEDLLGLYDAEFVQEAFRLLLGRAPDPQGLAHYLGHVRQGLDKRHVLMDVYSSSECKARLATQPSLQRFFPGRRAWLWPGIGPLLRKLDAWQSRRDVLRHLRMIDNDLHRHRTDVERQLQRLEALLGQSSFNALGALSSPHSDAEASPQPQVAGPIPPSLTAHGRYLYRLVQHRVINK